MNVVCVGGYCLFVVRNCRQTSKMVCNIYAQNLVCGFDTSLSIIWEALESLHNVFVPYFDLNCWAVMALFFHVAPNALKTVLPKTI